MGVFWFHPTFISCIFVYVKKSFPFSTFLSHMFNITMDLQILFISNVPKFIIFFDTQIIPDLVRAPLSQLLCPVGMSLSILKNFFAFHYKVFQAHLEVSLAQSCNQIISSKCSGFMVDFHWLVPKTVRKIFTTDCCWVTSRNISFLHGAFSLIFIHEWK